ncbi:MAG TPA: tRNA glutamyl-Q(34) synthetase GluQRS [Pseudolabrys sp.]|jgi:glutamyl-Q tRNA(Asp) synthetase
MPPVFRFAPSPNGYLHLGHALSALLNAGMARINGGRLLLRIEDIDTARCRPEYEAAIYEDLRWLGIQWDDSVRRQSEYWSEYRNALAQLQSRGLIYPSFESRAEIARLAAARDANRPWPCDPDGAPLYPGDAKKMDSEERARRIEAGEPYALRLDMKAALACSEELRWTETGAGPAGETGTITADPSIWGDVVLARKEIPTSYHLAVVVDDAAQGVTEVVRGSDLFHATALHRLLQVLLGLPEPRYHHHRLVLDEVGNKLSKSTQSTGLRELRARGATPAEIRRMAGLD